MARFDLDRERVRDREDPTYQKPRSRAQDFLIYFNVVAALLGLIFFILAAYVKTNFADQWSSVISSGAVWVGIFGGLIMMAVSFLGCYAARKNKKVYLCWYLLCVIVLVIIQIAAAAVMLKYSSSFAGASLGTSGALTNPTDIYVNNALISAFQKCCSGCAKGNCDNPNPASYSPKTLAYCTGRTASNKDENICDEPAACATNADPYCYNMAGGQVYIPSNNIEPGLCTVMRQLTARDGSLLVGYADVKGCGGGKIGTFMLNVNSYFAPKIYFVGVVFVLVACVQASVLLAGFWIICCVSKRVEDGV